jgi:L-malate glycosyltransferase
LKILLAVETLYPGGAEMFVLRLASALSARHEVVLFRIYPEAVNEVLVARHPGPFKHAWPKIPLDSLWRKVDRVIRLASLDFSFREWWVKRALRRLISTFKPDAIHSNQVKVDYVMAQVVQHEAFVITLHGDYKTFDELNDRPRRILNFNEKLKVIASKNPAFVYLADSQRKHLDSKNLFAVAKFNKIYNGYFNVPPTSHHKGAFFTFGMIARGIREKGWQIAIDAFLQVHKQYPHARLMLAGDSAFMQELQSRYSAQPDIHFVGHVAEPLAWISQLHVGLLPSYYSSESLPTSVIEYLLAGIPVIASNAGEIANMINTTGGSAGKTITIAQNNKDADLLAQEMRQYLTDSDLYKKHCAFAKEAFKKFDMQTCVEAYENLYRSELRTE